MHNQVKNIPIDRLVEPWILLRPVNRQSVEYTEMSASILEHGLFNSILVRPCPRREGYFEVVDGMYRFTCVVENGFDDVPAIVKELTDEQVLSIQISANAIRPETKPCEFARQLRRIQKANEGITLGQIASMVNKSATWVRSQLDLLGLPKHVQKAIDRGDICLQNAYHLARIPPKLRADHVKQAKVMSPREFGPLAASVLKAYQEALVQGKREAFYTDHFQPRAFLRPLKEVEEEAKEHLTGPLVVTKMNCETALDGWYAAIQWLMHLDPDSVKKQEEAARGRQRSRNSNSEGKMK